jgi:hypothetical protein
MDFNVHFNGHDILHKNCNSCTKKFKNIPVNLEPFSMNSTIFPKWPHSKLGQFQSIVSFKNS